jgi:transglycosylase-like protein
MHTIKEFPVRSVIVASCIFLAIPAVAWATPDPSLHRSQANGNGGASADEAWGTSRPGPISMRLLNPPPRKKKRRAPVRRRADWDAIARCESGGRWHYNGPSGFDGGLQFLPSTWTRVMRVSGYRFARYAYRATRVQQIAAAEYLLGPMGANPWRQWPYCWRFA